MKVIARGAIDGGEREIEAPMRAAARQPGQQQAAKHGAKAAANVVAPMHAGE
jgi:hypothetical protein